MKQLALLLILCMSMAVTAQTRLLRQPTIHQNKIVFVYANDLWITSANGGQSQRLTSNEGYESSPHFSPDGQWIAFSAQYDGNTDVYVIPAQGGEPKRLTWHPGGDIVQGWTPEGQVLFRSGRKSHPTQTNAFYTVGMEGGLPQSAGLPRAAFGEMSPDGKYMAYVPITFWDPGWRNYRGGQAMPIWIVDLKSMKLQRTPQPTAERHLDPVWFKGEVFYISERDYTANIWSFNPKTGAEKQHTFHKKYDVISIDADANGLVYEQGGYLNKLNPANGNTQQLNITVAADMNFSRPRWESVSSFQINSAAISPSGKRALFEHRGEIFSVPKEKGSWRNLTTSPGAADRAGAWSPKGDRIAWFSDASGEYQLMIADQKGVVQKRISFEEPTFYFRPEWSVDGKHLAFTDTHYNVWITNVDTGKSWIADTDGYAHPNRSMNPVWSPDGKWVAYAKQLRSHFKAVFAYNVDTKKAMQLTDGMADAISPVWDEGGEYLYFLASTDYGLQSGWLDMSSYDPSVNRSLYALVLKANSKAPVMPESDEEKAAPKADSKAKDGKGKKKEDKKEAGPKLKPVIIDAKGLFDRAVAMDLPARNYAGLAKAPKHFVFVWEAVPNARGLKAHKYDIKKQEASDYADGVNQMIVSHDRKSALLLKGRSWSISSTASAPKGGKDNLKMDLQVKVDPQAEYAQIFKEGWRFMRDFLYVDNTHGAPWNSIYEWYSPWVKHVRHRTDMNYLIDLMSGEIAVGHSYVGGGDMPDVDFVPVGLLGCDFETDGNYYKIGKIYGGERWNAGLGAPLGAPGMKVSEGDYILAIEGQTLTTATNPYALLEQRAGRVTRILVNSSPKREGARELLVEPVFSENRLRSVEWVESNRRKVDELSGGKLAYVYVPNTGGGGFTSFNRYYFAQQDKKGVVVDERNNGGGSAADYMIDIMARKPFGYFNSKAGDRHPWTTPNAGIWGPKVMIINERAGSGGDLLPYMFKAQGLGPLVGTRTWGGLVGTWDTPRFVDGGYMIAPRGGFYDLDGEWAVEGEGIAPDIEVIQDPKAVLSGKDPQLERAVQEALRLLKTEEFKFKPEPKPPVRWKRPAGYENDPN